MPYYCNLTGLQLTTNNESKNSESYSDIELLAHAQCKHPDLFISMGDYENIPLRIKLCYMLNAWNAQNASPKTGENSIALFAMNQRKRIALAEVICAIPAQELEVTLDALELYEALFRLINTFQPVTAHGLNLDLNLPPKAFLKAALASVEATYIALIESKRVANAIGPFRIANSNVRDLTTPPRKPVVPLTEKQKAERAARAKTQAVNKAKRKLAQRVMRQSKSLESLVAGFTRDGGLK